jgi:carbamoyltransferase
MAGHDSPWVLGVNASHNGAVCLLRGSEIVVAIQEERLTRIKRQRIYGASPALSIAYCLNHAGIQPRDLDMIVLCVHGPISAGAQNISANPLLQVGANRIPTLTIPHHYGHAMSAFATSGFDQSAVLVVDGMGSPAEDLFEDERDAVKGKCRSGSEIISLYAASGTSLHCLEKYLVKDDMWLTAEGAEMPRFRSLGGMYSAVAKQVFGNPMEAGKVMGLAPFGSPEVPTADFFDVDDGQFIFRDEVQKRFTRTDRWPKCEEQYRDLSCSVQVALENALDILARRLRVLCPVDNLCYAGGVALNSVANERIIRESGFEQVHIVPASEDSGIAVGAAYYGLWQLTGHNSRRRMLGDACGKTYVAAEISQSLDRFRGRIKVVESADVISEAADLLSRGRIIGWFQGGSELGPRALGQRSILCDPRRNDGKEVLNSKVKRRESFRPFAPAVLLEEVKNWFEIGGTNPASPFMLRVCNFARGKKDLVPAVVHVDGSGRLQTLTSEENGPFYDLVRSFYHRTGVPMVLNTSFNVKGEPIVETPGDAVACLLGTDLDCCVFGDRIVFKDDSGC